MPQGTNKTNEKVIELNLCFHTLLQKKLVHCCKIGQIVSIFSRGIVRM